MTLIYIGVVLKCSRTPNEVSLNENNVYCSTIDNRFNISMKGANNYKRGSQLITFV